jgi:hypothetical protein
MWDHHKLRGYAQTPTPKRLRNPPAVFPRLRSPSAHLRPSKVVLPPTPMGRAGPPGPQGRVSLAGNKLSDKTKPSSHRLGGSPHGLYLLQAPGMERAKGEEVEGQEGGQGHPQGQGHADPPQDPREGSP